VIKRIHVIINPAAGKKEPVLNILNDVFKSQGVSLTVSVTNEAGDATQFAKQALEDGADIIAAYGGDGTIMEVANGLIHTEVPMAIFPGGTGNVMAVELGIPQDLEQASRIILSESKVIRKIDVGQVGEDYFLLRMATGFDAERINLTSRELRDRFGRVAYFISALKAIPQSKNVHYEFLLDGKKEEIDGFTCLVENAASMGVPGMSLASDVSIQDGLLDVFCIRDLDLEAFQSVAASIIDQPLNSEKFLHWQVQEVTIKSDPPQPVVIDGEDWGETPVTAKVVPLSLQIITPSMDNPE
jgi:YegS/Rv2252/BmrU family lipid kinase